MARKVQRRRSFMPTMSDRLHHGYFQELAALAAIGELSGSEYAELQQHLETCSDCARDLGEFRQTMHSGLPLVEEEHSGQGKGFRGMDNAGAYWKRFAARAGIEPASSGWLASSREWLRSGLREWLSAHPDYAVGVVLALIVASGILGYHLRKERMLSRSQEAEIASLHQENSVLQEQLHGLTATEMRSVEATQLDHAELKRQLAAADAHSAQVTASYQALQEQLSNAIAENANLNADARTERDRGTTVEAKLRQSETSLAGMAAELQRLKASEQDREQQLAATQTLEAELATTNEDLGRAKRLLAADKDIRDLMGARNLHITDVYDIDAKGRTRQAFGRAFYTEGKSLIFYAFDLGKTKSPFREAAYQAWGYKEAAHTTQSLGILYMDDKAQNRWALKIDDGAVLSSIDAVFVTVEPPGGSAKPTGKKLLYAYLGAAANHP
jgi:hypothetical protein